MDPVFVYAHLNARIMPEVRGDFFEDPLIAAFEENGCGEVTGGGTMQTQEGEIEYCGVDIDLTDLDRGIPFLCDFFNQNGAPKGSRLEYTHAGQEHKVPIGVLEGLALYLNGTDLPDEVYDTCDINDLYDELEQLAEGAGNIYGHWTGPTETALYFYGPSAETIRSRIAPLIAEHPLCQKCRVVQIA